MDTTVVTVFAEARIYILMQNKNALVGDGKMIPASW